MEYLPTVSTNPQIPGDLSESPRYLLEIFLEIFSEIIAEIISERSLGISGHLEISENGREILQKCPSKFKNPQLKVDTTRGSLVIQESISQRGDISGDEIISKLKTIVIQMRMYRKFYKVHKQYFQR